MESLLGPRSLGEESLQMWDLNKRLEAYLARVKYLEEENELLKAEVQGLRVSPQEKQPWRSRYEGEVAALRAALDQAFREESTAELARESLYAEVQRVKSQCQKERSAREEARRLLSLSRKELEEEERAQLWLREKAVQLEKEMEAQVQGHQEDLAALDQEVAAASWGLESFRAGPAPAGSSPQAEVEDYAQRLSGLWKGAVETYQAEVCRLEASLCQAKEHLWKATEGHRQSQQQLQQLENELSGLKLQKEMLEESLAQDWQQQQGEAEKMQLAIESLEEEKRSLRVQIAQVLEDRQQLMHLKMSLSVEVATYRTLLETESTRLQLPATSFKLPSGLKDSTFGGSHRQLQVASLGRGYFGSRDFKPSPTSTPKGKPWLLKSQTESFATNLASTLPKSGRSPVAREFQKANIVLQSQPSKTFDVAPNPKDAADFTEVAATFPLGLSQQNKRIEATETVSPSFFHGFLPGQNFLSHVNGEVSEEESASSPGGRSQEEGEGGDEVAQREAEEPDPEGEEEEEEEDASAAHDTPSLTRLVTETLGVAAREVNGEKICHEPNSTTTSETQKGSPSKDEERNREASSPSREESEGAAQEGVPEGQKRDGQPTDQPEEVKGVEHTIEANGGQESYLEWTEEEEEEGGRFWVSQETEPAFPLQSGFPKEERGREATAATGGVAPLAAQREVEKEARPSEQGGGPRTEEPLEVEQGEGPEGAHTPPPGPLGKEAGKESWQPSSPSDPHRGALGGSLEEMEGRGGGGGEEDVEVGGTEPSLHLSEEEEEEEEEKERTPPKGENECEELQAGSGLGLEGGFALDQGPPTSHTTSAAASGQELLSRPEVAQRERPEHSGPLCESDSALAEAEEEEEEEEIALVAKEETLSREETPEARGEENTWAGEVRREEDEEERRKEMLRDKDVAQEENPSGTGEAGERGSASSTEGATKRQDFPLSHEGEDGLEKEEATEQEGGSEEQGGLQEDNTVGREGRTGQDRRSSGKAPRKEENHLESEDALGQGGFSDTEPIGQMDLLETERDMETEETLEREGFSEVENVGQKELQEKENEMENEDSIAMESFSATEDVADQAPHQEETHLGGTEAAEEQEGFPGTESVGPLGLHREVKGLEHEATTGQESLSGVETSKDKPLSQARDNTGNDETVKQDGATGVQAVGAQDLPKEEDVLGNGPTVEKTSPSEAERAGAQDLQAEENPLAKEDPAGEEVSSHTDVASSQEEAACQPDVAFLRDENLLGQGPAEETSSHSEERPWMEEEGKEDTAGLSPAAESDVTGEDSNVGLDALAVGREEATGTWEAGEVTGAPKANHLQAGEEDPPQGSSAATGSGTDDARVAKEGQAEAAGGGEEDTTPLQQAPVASQEEPHAPSETHSSHVTHGPMEGAGDGKERGSHELPSDASGSEESLGSSDASTNATGEMDGALGGEEEELSSRKHVLLEETLPDSTPLYMYDEQMWGAAGTGQRSPESQEAAFELPPSSQGRCEEERLHSPPLRGNAQEQEATEEEAGGHAEVVPGPQELPQASAPSEETDAGKAGLPHESQDLHAAAGLEGPRREEGPGENPERLGPESDPQSFHTESSSVEGSNKPIGPAHQEENGADLAAKGSVPQADLPEAPRSKESCREEDGRPLEPSGGSHAEGGSDTCKASPLTSVADLGEIVLEGDAAATRDFEAGREEGLPDAQGPQPLAQPGSRGREEGLFGTHPGSKGSPEGPAESTKEADILEIVAQALEFNQELIKVAEERAEAELLSAAAGGETVGPPKGRPPSDSVPFSEVKESQVLEEAPNASSSSSSTQDPTNSNPLWVATDANGVQLDPRLSDATKALELNGIGGFPPSRLQCERSPSAAEEFVTKAILTQEEPHREEREGLSTGAATPAGKVLSLFPEEGFLDPKGPEEEEEAARERKESQTDGMKGRKEAEAVPGLPHLEVETIPGQLLKFQTGEGGLWAQEGN